MHVKHCLFFAINIHYVKYSNKLHKFLQVKHCLFSVFDLIEEKLAHDFFFNQENAPWRKSPSYVAGMGTSGASKPSTDFITASKAALPYCYKGKNPKGLNEPQHKFSKWK